MQNDRIINISTGASRRATQWIAQTLLVSELWEKLRVPARSTESLAEYMSLKKAQQDDLKDIGGFVGGTLKGMRRKADHVAGRDIITLDLTIYRRAIKTTCYGVSRLWGAGTVCIVPANTNRLRPACEYCFPLTGL